MEKYCIPVHRRTLANGHVQWYCARCRYDRHIEKHGNFPDRIRRVCDVQINGLGDYIGLALARVGITKQRWAKWTGKPIAEQKTGCGSCQQREQQINHLGWRFQGKLNRFGWWVKYRVAWLKSLACRLTAPHKRDREGEVESQPAIYLPSLPNQP
jgi:hypothetical protein